MSSTEVEKVETRDALASFLFDLIRDYVPLGRVEKILQDLEKTGPRKFVFDDPHLGRYVIGLALRIHAQNTSMEPIDG